MYQQNPAWNIIEVSLKEKGDAVEIKQEEKENVKVWNLTSTSVLIFSFRKYIFHSHFSSNFSRLYTSY